MIIQCTKKLLDKLSLKNEDLVSAEKQDIYSNSLYAWHANLVNVNRRKAIVFMNNLTRYTIVLYRPKAKDIAKLEERLKEGVDVAFAAEGVKRDVIEQYLQNLGECQFSKTANRSIVASLNEVCRQVCWFDEYLDESQVVQDRISVRLGKTLSKYEGEYIQPNEQLFKALCKMTKSDQDNWEKILEVENYQLKIKLNLENYDIWRRILIPSTYTFANLHQTIQTIFGWFNYHLHEFCIKETEDVPNREELTEPELIKIRIVDGNDPEVYDYLEPDKYTVLTDTKTSLKDIFGDTTECYYTYDFGDNWEHIITLEKVEKEKINFSPILLEREGKRPPEDVGGEGGFEEYMEIISSENNPCYNSIKQWAEGTSEREYSIEQINLLLKR